jgi:neurofibromin 1
MLLFPFQTSLLLLLPDVFEVASNMRDVKSSSMSKKVSFLDMLRKTLRNRNETSIYCLTSILRVARHFPMESEAALLSYALDVQVEVREAVFRRYTPGVEAQSIDKDLMTASFVSLTHLNFESCVDSLVPLCLAPTSPPDFKIAVVTACTHFARQSNAVEYSSLFERIAEFIRTQLTKDAYIDEYQVAKVEATQIPEIISCILVFLSASPLTLFIGAPSGGEEWQYFFNDVFTSTIKYLTADDARVRYLTNTVARKILSEGSGPFWRRNKGQDNRLFVQNLWKSTLV